MEAVRRVGEFADRLSTASAGTPELAAAATDAQARFRSALVRRSERAGGCRRPLHVSFRRANAELDRKGKDVAALEEAGGLRAHGPNIGHSCRGLSGSW